MYGNADYLLKMRFTPLIKNIKTMKHILCLLFFSLTTVDLAAATHTILKNMAP